MIPKPEPRAKVKARQKRQQAAARKACVDAVWERDMGQCQWYFPVTKTYCHKRLQRPENAATWLTVGHVHEIKPRSLGGDPTNPEKCVLVCPTHHKIAHEIGGIYSPNVSHLGTER